MKTKSKILKEILDKNGTALTRESVYEAMEEYAQQMMIGKDEELKASDTIISIIVGSSDEELIQMRNSLRKQIADT